MCLLSIDQNDICRIAFFSIFFFVPAPCSCMRPSNVVFGDVKLLRAIELYQVANLEDGRLSELI